MVRRYIVKAAAYLEIVVGAIFITVPNIPCALLFGGAVVCVAGDDERPRRGVLRNAALEPQQIHTSFINYSK